MINNEKCLAVTEKPESQKLNFIKSDGTDTKWKKNDIVVNVVTCDSERDC